MPGRARRILVIGASARAAAYSLRRAGFEPCAIDLFADADLVELCPTVRVRSFEDDLEAAAQQLGSDAWMYAGGLENHPDQIDALAARWPLIGNSGAVVRAVRDPETWSGVLCRAGFPIPQLGGAVSPAKSCTWLLKPRCSGGGQGIRTATHLPPRLRATHYLQQFIPGSSWGATYLAGPKGVALLGVCRQLTGTTACGARGFQYAGSIGPCQLNAAVPQALMGLGQTLVAEFSLRGIFGVDFIWNADGIWPVEINPRYAASFELLERADPQLTLARHIRAFQNEEPPPGISPPVTLQPRASLWGKAIAYARRDWIADERFMALVEEFNTDANWPGIADLPGPGTSIPRGHPIATIFACGQDDSELEQELFRRVSRVN